MIPPLPGRDDDATTFLARCQGLNGWLREGGDFAGEVMLPATITRLLTIELRTTARRLRVVRTWQETCRRAERAAHLAIARARADGVLISRGGRPGTAGQSGVSLTEYGLPRTWSHKSSPWGVTLSDADFEAALAEGWETDALSQVRFTALLAARGETPQARRRLTVIATMARNGHSSAAIATKLDLAATRVRALACQAGIAIPGDAADRRQRRIDPNRLIPQTISALDALRQGIELIVPTDFASTPADQRRAWAEDLDTILRDFRALIKELRRADQDH